MTSPGKPRPGPAYSAVVPHQADEPRPLPEVFSDAQILLQRAPCGQTDSAFNRALQMIGEALDADRAYSFVIRDLTLVEHGHEWCAPGIAATRPALREIPDAISDMLWSAFRRDGMLAVPNTASLSSGADLRQTLIDKSIRSLICVPIFEGSEIQGFVGLDYLWRRKAFSPLVQNLLRSFAATVGAVLQRDRLARREARHLSDLRLTQTRLTAMLAAVPELIIETDRDGVVIGYHQSQPLIFALNPQEVIGTSLEACVPPHLRKIVSNARAEVDKAAWSPTYRYSLTIDGETKRFALFATRRDTARNCPPTGYLFVVREITESYLQDRRIQKLSQVAEISSNLIILLDCARRVTWMNPAAADMTETSLQDAMGRHVRDVLRVQSAAPALVAQVQGDAPTPGPVRSEIKFRSASGLTRWLDLNMQPLQDPDRATQGFMLVGSDITTLKMSEARALRDMARAMDASQDGIAISLPNGTLSYLNPVMREILKLPRDLPAADLTWQDVSPPSFVENLVHILPVLHDEGYWNGDIVIDSADGAERHVDISMSIQEDGCVLTIARDITARKLAAQERAHLNEKLQLAQSRQLVAQLSSGLAHDVANIMAAISGSSATLRGFVATEGLQHLARIEAAAHQAHALAARLTRLGDRRPHFGALDLIRLTRQAIDLVRPTLDASVDLATELPDHIPEVIAEETGVIQVMLNLILNARDAARRSAAAPNRGPETQGRVSVRLTEQISDDIPHHADLGRIFPSTRYVVLEVQDNGPGISATERKQIFRPYHSSKPDDGAGLGLAIVADILMQTGAALELCSTHGEGSIFRVFWPATSRNAAQGPVIEAPESMARPLAGLSVLLVDDDDQYLQQMSQALSRAGAEVASCIAPGDAVEAMTEDPSAWDMVITDHEMSPMTGLDLARQLRKIRPELPILLASGKSELHFAKESAQHAVSLILKKPIASSVLVASLLSIRLRS